MRVVDTTTLEVDVTREKSLNEVFRSLDQSGIKVSSMRNKTNRLEELFVNLVRNVSNGS